MDQSFVPCSTDYAAVQVDFSLRSRRGQYSWIYGLSEDAIDINFVMYNGGIISEPAEWICYRLIKTNTGAEWNQNRLEST
jgi:hypothetical protein